MKLEFKLSDINKEVKKSEWERGILLSLAVSLILFLMLNIFLFFKPASKAVRTIIDEEVSSIDINFNKKTLEMLEERQKPEPGITPVVGKNPFMPF